MIHEKCYGLIPLREKEGKWQVFLIKHKNGLHWGFPKGHPEEKENDHKKVAEREFKEETNLEVVRYLSEQVLEEKYTFTRDSETVSKQVYYFIVEAKGEIQLQTKEILEGLWINIDEAENKITFPQSKEICRKMQKII